MKQILIADEQYPLLKSYIWLMEQIKQTVDVIDILQESKEELRFNQKEIIVQLLLSIIQQHISNGENSFTLTSKDIDLSLTPFLADITININFTKSNTTRCTGGYVPQRDGVLGKDGLIRVHGLFNCNLIGQENHIPLLCRMFIYHEFTHAEEDAQRRNDEYQLNSNSLYNYTEKSIYKHLNGIGKINDVGRICRDILYNLTQVEQHAYTMQAIAEYKEFAQRNGFRDLPYNTQVSLLPSVIKYQNIYKCIETLKELPNSQDKQVVLNYINDNNTRKFKSFDSFLTFSSHKLDYALHKMMRKISKHIVENEMNYKPVIMETVYQIPTDIDELIKQCHN